MIYKFIFKIKNKRIKMKLIYIDIHLFSFIFLYFSFFIYYYYHYYLLIQYVTIINKSLPLDFSRAIFLLSWSSSSCSLFLDTVVTPVENADSENICEYIDLVLDSSNLYSPSNTFNLFDLVLA